MLALYGHPFSSYTWKALIPLYANGIAFDFRMVDPDHPENAALVRKAGPLGKFPVLDDGGTLVFEATSIIEWIDRHHGTQLIPGDPEEALGVRMLDRVFDNYVMNIVQDIVAEYLREGTGPDQRRVAESRGLLARSYGWLEDWLARYPSDGRISLVECAAAPSLFYADWVYPIGEDHERLKAWRAHLLALPPVRRCVEEARPYRAFFPLGAPDRD